MTEIHISVRSLVEFLYRYGDIDSSGEAVSADAMQAGARIHRRIQSMAGSGYRAEYALSYSYDSSLCHVTIEGRADGVISTDTSPMTGSLMSDPGTASLNMIEAEGSEAGPAYPSIIPDEYMIIDEIKTTNRNVNRMSGPDPVHLAQAKVYAAIYLMAEGLSEIYVRMTYVNRDSEEIRYFYSEYSASEITAWFEATTSEMAKWLDMQAEWTDMRQNSIHEMEFPYQYRPGQRELAEYVYRTIYHGRKLFIEAPTGTGKTLSVLFPALKSMGEGRGNRIFYLTARTIARTVAEDAVNTLREQGLKLKSITLTAKEKICFMDETRCTPEACPYAKGHYDRVNDCLFEMVSGEESYPRAVIEEYAGRHMVCPFELALDLSLYSDCIICDYNYVFDPNAYLRRFFAEGREGDYLFLVDEAHNLVDRGREMYSAVMIKEDLMEARRACAKSQPRIARAISKCNKDMLEIKKTRGDASPSELVVMNTPGELVGHLDRTRQVISEYLADHREGPGHDEILELYFEICEFLNIYDCLGPDYCIYNAMTSDMDFYVKLMCVDPARNLSDRMGQARSTVLFSATLLPVQYYKALLGGTQEDYEVYANSVFDAGNRLMIRARDITTRYSGRSRGQYERMAEYIHRISAPKEGNYLVFAPSYHYMENVAGIYSGKYPASPETEIIIQSNGMREREREEFLEKFRTKDKGTLIGFCVLGGIFAEGIDLRDDALIGVIIMGTGLPQIGGERDLLRSFFDRDGHRGYEYAYAYPGMNRVQQAAGRLIRTETDCGVIALLDDRFAWDSNVRMFPREWNDIRDVTIDTVGDAVVRFWNSRVQ